MQQIDDYDKENLTKIASNQAFKLQRYLHSPFTLDIHIKEYGKDGQQRKYSVHIRAEFPGQILTASQDDWDIITALRKTFDNLENKSKSRFKG